MAVDKEHIFDSGIYFLTIIILLFILFSCNKNIRKIILTTSDSNGKMGKYIAYIPKGYKMVTIKANGESGTNKEYCYPDSSIIYLSDNRLVDFNYYNLSDAKLLVRKFEFMDQDSVRLDTLLLSGQDKNGLFWKEILTKEISIGYLNVPKYMKKTFDKALSTLSR